MAKANPIYKALEARGFETVGEMCFGSWKGYAADLRPYSGYYYLDVAVRVDKKDKDLRKRVQKTVKRNNSGRSLGCINNGKYLTFTVSFNKKTPYEQQFAAYMEAIIAALNENGVSAANTCAVCGGSGPDSLCAVGSYQPVHSACTRDMYLAVRDAAQENQENGSYITGFIGALLGMLVGLVPNLLTAMFMDEIYSMFFALVPLAAMFGYRKFRGKLNNGAVGIVVVLSFISVFVMQFLLTGFYVMDEQGLSLGLAFSFVAEELLNLKGLGMIANYSLAHFLFMFLGVWISWTYIKQTNKGSLRQMDAVLKTLRPDPAAGYGAQETALADENEING